MSDDNYTDMINACIDYFLALRQIGDGQIEAGGESLIAATTALVELAYPREPLDHYRSALDAFRAAQTPSEETTVLELRVDGRTLGEALETPGVLARSMGKTQMQTQLAALERQAEALVAAGKTPRTIVTPDRISVVDEASVSSDVGDLTDLLEGF